MFFKDGRDKVHHPTYVATHDGKPGKEKKVNSDTCDSSTALTKLSQPKIQTSPHYYFFSFLCYIIKF